MPSSAISKATTHFLQFRIQYSSIAFLYYDYLLTFPAEVEYMWKRKFRISTLLYILCRYALVANVLFLLGIANKLSNSCDSSYKAIAALSVLGRTAVIITFTARTFAVYGKSLYILALLGTLGLTCVILDIIHAPGVKCVGGSSIQIVNTLLSIFMCIFEFSSAILTTIRCVQELHISGGFRKASKSSFFYLVLQQGVLYFTFVSIFTTAAAILNFRAPPGSFEQRLPNAITLPLSCTLTARFLLHLRQWGDQTEGTRRADPASSATVATMSALRVAIPTALSLDDFGEDPIPLARLRKRKLHGGEKRRQEYAESHEETNNPKAHAIELTEVASHPSHTLSQQESLPDDHPMRYKEGMV